ncbi:MAG: CarD family transcriptional regulator [Clostridia bacterium]|nr:CarD family transcriptional regulator [Clostridia bacterium]
MFEIGSYVSYRAEGVCMISDIREERFGALGAMAKYYILSPVGDEKSTVFVPMDNERLLSMMRPLLSADEILQMVEELRDERMEWIEESRARNARFREIFADGDRKQLIVLLNTVAEHSEMIRQLGKKVGSTDENAMYRAKTMLFEEFSMTTDLSSMDEILPLLRGERKLRTKKICAIV